MSIFGGSIELVLKVVLHLLWRRLTQMAFYYATLAWMKEIFSFQMDLAFQLVQHLSSQDFIME